MQGELFEVTKRQTQGKYGVPYMGSKSDIAEWVVQYLPAGAIFYDLFAGGCAVTHCALLSRKFEKIIANDIGTAPQLFWDAVNGKYTMEKCAKKWVSRKEFQMCKETDPYIKYCWSFGNNGRDYLYGKEIEEYKRRLTKVLTAGTINERRLAFRSLMKAYSLIENYSLESLQTLQSLQGLQGLENLQRLQGLESLQGFEISRKDYADVEIVEGAVVYCDIPYRGTAKYDCNFDYERFYAWCQEIVREKGVKLFVSEYSMPAPFIVVAERSKTSKLCKNKTNNVIEKIFTL